MELPIPGGDSDSVDMAQIASETSNIVKDDSPPMPAIMKNTLKLLGGAAPFGADMIKKMMG